MAASCSRGGRAPAEEPGRRRREVHESVKAGEFKLGATYPPSGPVFSDLHCHQALTFVTVATSLT